VTKHPGYTSISMFSAVSIILNFGFIRDHVRFGTYFKDGILDCIFFFMFMFLQQMASTHLYLKCLPFDDSFSFAGLWSLTFGRKTAWIGRVFVFLSCMDTTFGITIVFSGLFQQMALANWPTLPSILLNTWFLAIFLPLFVVVPCLFFKEFGSLRWPSLVGNLGLLMSVVGVVMDTFQQRETFSVGPEVQWWTGNLPEILQMFYMTCTAPATLVLPDVLGALDRGTPARAMKLIWIVFGIISVLVVTCGILGYITYFRWFDCVGLLFYDLMDPRSPVTIVCEMGVLLNILFTDAVFIWWLSRQLTVFVVPDNRTALADLVSGFTLVLFTLMTSFAPEKLCNILDFIAAIARLSMLYVVPSLFYLKFFGFQNLFWSIPVIILLLCGLGITAGGLYWGVDHVMDAYQPANPLDALKLTWR
jgi:hypothetical protein